MNAMRCGNEKYSTGNSSFFANSSAIRFSKPSPLVFENGRLLGSWQARKALRSSSCASAAAAVKTSVLSSNTLRATHLCIGNTRSATGRRAASASLDLFNLDARDGSIRPAFEICIQIFDVVHHHRAVAEAHHAFFEASLAHGLDELGLGQRL